MTRLNDQYGGGIDPWQDQSAGGRTVLDTRLVRYAARIKDVDQFTRPVIERDSVGDIVCGTRWEPTTRPISAWAHAWPVVGGSPVRASGMSASAADGGVLAAAAKAAAADGNAGAKAGGKGSKLKATADVIVLDRSKTFGGELGGGYLFGGSRTEKLKPTATRIYVNPRTTFAFGWQYPVARVFNQARGAWESPAGGGGGGGGGGSGARGAAGPFGQPGGAGIAGVLPPVVTGEGMPAAPSVDLLPVYGFASAPDTSFRAESIPLPAGYPSMPGGTVGTLLGGTDHRTQQPVYLHGDPRLVAVNEGPDPTHSSMVYDTDAQGGYDLSRWARLHSAWRVTRPFVGVLPWGPGGTLAWQLLRGERDGVAGHGAVVDLGSLSRVPVTTPGGSTPVTTPGGAGGATKTAPTPLATIASAAPTDRALLTGLSLGGVNAALALNYYKPKTQPGAPASAQPADRAAVARNDPATVVAITSARQGGPIEVGHAHRDRHAIGKAGEANVNIGHLACGAAWYADPTKDGPLLFERAPYPDVERHPLRTRVHLQYASGYTPEIRPDGTLRLPGAWAWWAEAPSETEGGPPTPPPTTPPRQPPPTTPPPPTKPPPVVTPRDDLPGFRGGQFLATARLNPPLLGARRGAGGMETGGATVGGPALERGGGLGARMVSMRAVQPANRVPGPFRPDEVIAPTTRPVSRLDTVRNVRQRPAGFGGPTDQVTGHHTASAHTVLLFRPQELEGGALDLRSTAEADADQVRRITRQRPMVGRLEAWGARVAGAWTRTQGLGASRFDGGTGAGGLLLLPPELDMADVSAGSYSGTPSASYLAAYPGTYIGWGVPVLSTGALGTGYRAGVDASGVLTFQRLSSTGSATTVFGGNASSQFTVREGSGTLLTFSGTLADGEYLKRSGTTLVGGTPSGSVGDADYGDITVSSSGTVWTIDNDVVTNAKAANMANGTIKGRKTAGAGDPEDLSGTQVTTLLDAVVGDSGSGGTKGLVPAPAAGDAAAGKVLKADGTWAVPPTAIEAKSYSNQLVGPSSSSEGDLFLLNTALAAGDILRLRMFGRFKNDSGAGRTVTIRVRYGSTELIGIVSPSVGAGATDRSWSCEVDLVAEGTSAQIAHLKFQLSQPVASPGTGGSLLANAFYDAHGSSAEDSTSAKDFKVTAQLSASHASLEIERLAYHIERL